MMKTASILFSALLALALLCGCGGEDETTPTPSAKPVPVDTGAGAPEKATGMSPPQETTGAGAPEKATGMSPPQETANEFVTVGKDNWLFLPGELEFLSHGEFWGDKAAAVSKSTRADWADPFPAITNFQASLAAKGIDLLVVPVPAKGQIYADKLVDAGDQPMVGALQTFYAALRDAGVNVMDLTADFEAAKATTPVHCQTDTHWTPSAIEMTAEKIHTAFADKDWVKAIEKQDYATETSELDYIGDLNDLGKLKLPAEKLRVTRVGTKVGDKLQPVGIDLDSPILVIGDSHTLFCHEPSMVTNGGGLTDHLAKHFGIATDLIGKRGSASTVTRIEILRAQGKALGTGGDYLAKKKLVVWCFAARELTQSTGGWRVLPIEKK